MSKGPEALTLVSCCFGGGRRRVDAYGEHISSAPRESVLAIILREILCQVHKEMCEGLSRQQCS